MYVTRSSAARWLAAATVLLTFATGRGGSPQPALLPPAQVVADGIEYFELTDPEPLGIPGPIAVQLLHLDPARVDLRVARAQDYAIGKETVPAIAFRVGAVAAVNAGFFVVQTGEPAGLSKVDGELVRDTALARGAVAIWCGPGGPALAFDRVTAQARLSFGSGRTSVTVPIASVNTTRAKNGPTLYTPRYGSTTGTPPAGIEWILKRTSRTGRPPPSVFRVTGRREGGDSVIPRDGAVLSYGAEPRGPLRRLRPGIQAALDIGYTARLGSPAALWEEARHIVGGAGLLMRGGEAIDDWTEERLRAGFTTERHPRTMIGVDRAGAIWLVTVDGRNPEVSIGMTFSDLQALARTLSLRDALNLDGGGSTTMVVEGRVRNHPSDATGPRPVSDALVVFPRSCSR